MVKYFQFLILLITADKARTQSIFKAVRSDRFQFSFTNKPADKDTGTYYRIAMLINGKPWATPGYPITHPDLKQIDTIKAIEELLKFQGDTRICALQVGEYNPLRSRIYTGKILIIPYR